MLSLELYNFTSFFLLKTNFGLYSLLQDSERFSKQIERALADIKLLFEEYHCLKKLANGSAK